MTMRTTMAGDPPQLERMTILGGQTSLVGGRSIIAFAAWNPLLPMAVAF